MENPIEATVISGMWRNDTSKTVTISWNGQPPIAPIAPGSYSGLHVIRLTDLMMLEHTIVQGDLVSYPILLWEGRDVTVMKLFQQNARFENWYDIDLFASGIHHYVFQLIDDTDGLVIVGTVELVEELPVPAQA